MCKTLKTSFDEKLTFENLLEAHKRASKNKRNKKELLKFNIDLETNITNILINLKKGTYKMGSYFVFNVYEPKLRIIKALPYRDRIVQQWYIEEFIKPYILPRFIKDSYACINNKGTHLAVKTVQKYMRIMKGKYKDYYIIKGDIKKFFYNIDKDILYKLMKNYISDKKLLALTKIFIYDNEEKLGIPIGNYTSQYFANIYLNELDKFVKEKLRVRYYVRYMDDFIILEQDRNKAKILLKEIGHFVDVHLKLQLNYKSRYYPNKMGVNFCGYRIFETHLLLRNRSKKIIKKNIKCWNRLYIERRLDYHKMLLCWNSWVGHAKHANSYNFRIKMYNQILAKEYLSER